jgi:hypothetical protein
LVGKGRVTLATEAKQRLPVPEPRECPANADRDYRRQNSPEQKVGDQEHRAGHRQGEEGQFLLLLDLRNILRPYSRTARTATNDHEEAIYYDVLGK